MPRGSLGIDLRIVANVDEVFEHLVALDTAFNATAMTEFMFQEVGPWLRQRARNRFQNEGDEAVGKWAPLAPATQKIREHGREKGYWPDISAEHPINVRSHDMERHITQGIGSMDFLEGASTYHFPDKNVPAKIAEKMTTAQKGSGRTKARPVLGMSGVDTTKIMADLSRYVITRVAGRRGF